MITRSIEGTIVITDPCYILDYEKWDKPNFIINRGTLYGDWRCHTMKGDISDLSKIKEYRDKYVKVFHKFNMSDKTDEEKTEILKEYKNLRKEYFNNNTCYGQFCADSGTVCVIDYDECLNYKPDFKEWQESHKHCATIIEEFKGFIEDQIIDGELYIIGKGNKPFYTCQTGF